MRQIDLPALFFMTLAFAPGPTQADLAPINNGNPNWSPVEQKILFSSDRDGNSEIYVLDVTTLVETRLTRTEADELHASWSPDGKTIAFDSDRSGNMDIYLMNPEGAGVVQLTNTPEQAELVPVWSPDGTKIAFNRRLEDGFDIFVMDADGQNPVNLTREPGNDIVRGWSRDGKWLPFNSDRSGNQEIYLMSADGSAVPQLTQNGAENRIAIAAPGGDSIFFASSMQGARGGRGLFAVGLDGENAKLVFDSDHEDYCPAWAPDGDILAVVIRSERGTDIYQVSEEGEVLRRLTGAGKQSN